MQKLLRVRRVIDMVGKEDWVEKGLRYSPLNKVGDDYSIDRMKITLISMEREEIEVNEKETT